MKFAERDAGDYRIYAGVIEMRGHGYQPTLVIVRVRGLPEEPPAEAYRAVLERSFPHADLALDHAFAHAMEVLRNRRTLLSR